MVDLFEVNFFWFPHPDLNRGLTGATRPCHSDLTPVRAVGLSFVPAFG